MKNLTIILFGNNNNYLEEEKYEIIYINNGNYKEALQRAKGCYVTFVKEEDKMSKDYLKEILDKTEYEFDAYFINYDITYKYKNKMKINANNYELCTYRPYYGEYIWSFIYKREKLLRLLENHTEESWNTFVDNEFKNVYAITKLLYFHNPNGKKFINYGPLLDIKEDKYFKNLIYMGDGCNGAFNGYISWILNLGRCFSKKYEITILYDHMPDQTRDVISKYFKCIQRERKINYVADILFTTYSTYYYPKNIYALEENSLFIHGNMSDYDYTSPYVDDIYTNYIGVSKTAAKKAKGYFPTKHIKSIVNPFKLDKELLKPHLKLTSALRYSTEKAPERIEYMGRLLDELGIPYTWNVFTDQKENTNESNGLIFRSRIYNPLPFINDCDYFVLLSNSEAMPYCILEALACNKKLIVTPLPAYKELGLRNGKGAFMIPFEYFEEQNKEKLKKLILKIYKEKDKKTTYKLDEKLWDDYNKLFRK